MRKQSNNPDDGFTHIRIRKSSLKWIRSKAEKGNRSMALVLEKIIEIAKWYDKNRGRIKIQGSGKKP